LTANADPLTTAMSTYADVTHHIPVNSLVSPSL
jgi:hypothetical protein